MSVAEFPRTSIALAAAAAAVRGSDGCTYRDSW